jgi:hypothetical protein
MRENYLVEHTVGSIIGGAFKIYRLTQFVASSEEKFFNVFASQNKFRV